MPTIGADLGQSVDADQIPFTPTASVAATEVQAAIVEVAAEAAAAVHTHNYAPLGATTVAAAGTTETLTVTDKSDFHITLDANCTISTTGWPAGVHDVVVVLKQGGTGNYTVTWADVDEWEESQAPVIDGTVGAETVVVLRSLDSGTTIKGYHGLAIRMAPWSTPSNTDLATRTASPSLWFRRAGRIVGVKLRVDTAPTGAAIIVDVNVNGTTIFTTQANRPTIAISGTSSTYVTNMNTTAVAADSYITVNIDQVGSTNPGQGLTVYLFFIGGL